MSLSSLQIVPRVLLLPFCLAISLPARSDDTGRFMRLGDAAYAQKSYDSAVSYYQLAGAGTTRNPVALFKLGNAHYRLRHIGEAMLSYERALLYQPGFALAARNAVTIQRLVRPGSEKEIFFLQWWRALTAPEYSNFWASLAVILFAGVLGVMAWARYSGRRSGRLRSQIIVGAFALTGLLVLFSLSGVLRDRPKAAAIIMRSDAKFRPIAGGAKVGLSLPEGLLVKVLHKQAEDVTIELPDGQEGFVQRSDIAIVE